MKNHFLRLIVVLSFITIFGSCSQDNGAGGGTEPPVTAALAGTYRTLEGHPGVVRATIAIESDNSGNIFGEVVISGAESCFGEGSFSSSNSASRFDSQSRTGTIEAIDGSSKALLFFSVSADYGTLEIEGGKSQLLDAAGNRCLVLETLRLHKKPEVSGR